MLELTERSDVCACADTIRFLNADEHNPMIVGQVAASAVASCALH
jgi:hypothetical protein